MLFAFHLELIRNRDLHSILQGYLWSDFCTVLWYVESLLLLLIFVRPIKAVMSRPVISEGILLALLFCDSMNWRFVPQTAFTERITLSRFLLFVPSYFVGAYFALRMKKYVLCRDYPVWLKGISLILFVFSIAMNAEGILGEILFRLHPVFLWILIPERLFVVPPPAFMKRSFMYYVMHNAVFSYLGALFYTLNIGFARISDWSAVGIGTVVGYRILMVTLNIFCCIVLTGLLERFLPGVYGVLSGGRTDRTVRTGVSTCSNDPNP